jgi:glycosyltransferase involved in cell wall biosynthesis
MLGDVLRPLRVCIFSESLYPVVSRGRVPIAGGAEVQLALTGRSLAEAGCDVSVVTCDFGQPEGLQVDGMTLLRCYPPNPRIPVIRFLHPRLTGGFAALRRADADVYLYQGAGLWAGLVRDFAALHGRAYVWMVAHDHDCLAQLPDVHGPRDRFWAKRAIRLADEVVSQTNRQWGLLKESFQRESVVIPNPVELPAEDRVVDVGQQPSLVWLGTYKPSKRPGWFLRFAERHPEVPCRMAGAIPSPDIEEGEWAAARAAAERLPNLEVNPTIPHEQVGEFLRRSTLFVHSSPAEGFPNVFLEAWALGLPCVTSFDPDGIIEREGLGACRDRYETWEQEIERRLRDPDLRRAEGARARHRAASQHAAPAVIQRLLAVLRSATDRRGRQSASNPR